MSRSRTLMRAGTMRDRELYRLTSWLSPSFPVGAYAYSHGLEHAVESGAVAATPGLQDWLRDILLHGSCQVDGVLFRNAWKAARNRDASRLRELAEIAAAFRGTRELSLESAAQGEAFLDAVKRAWTAGPPVLFTDGDARVSYCVAVGSVCGAHGIPLGPALQTYIQAFAANLVSAGVRLIPLGQSDGQNVLARLEPVVLEAARRCMATELEDMGTMTPMVDWSSMMHETQHTRLFRS